MPMFSTYQRARLLLVIAALLCYTILWTSGAMFAIPSRFGYGASLVNQPSPTLSMFVLLVVGVACVLVGTIIAGTIRFDAGLCAAAIGMAALSIGGGPIRYVLMTATGPGIYIGLAVELLLLFAILGMGWALLWLLSARGLLKRDPFRDGVADIEEPWPQKVLALATHVVVMALLMLLLAKTDEKAQAIAAVFVSSYLATLAAHYLFPTQPSVWYWTGPLIVGGLGYLIACWTTGASWRIGEVGGYAPELARALPLDYASAGPAGAIIAYWMSRRWLRARGEEAATE